MCQGLLGIALSFWSSAGCVESCFLSLASPPAPPSHTHTRTVLYCNTQHVHPHASCNQTLSTHTHTLPAALLLPFPSPPPPAPLSLSGLKRHSVSLFEGGRVSGPAVMDELIGELAASAEAGALFEGEDMAQVCVCVCVC